MQAFESWDCTPPVLTPRSRLYALEPIGIGTPFVESLSGYIARLAEAHAVSVGDLVGRELSSSKSKPLTSFGQFTKQRRVNSHRFHARAHAINGFGESSKRWIDALEMATLQKDLRFLTLSLFDGVFSRQGATRHSRAWCPKCYDEWRTRGAIIYEPLLWSIDLVVLCTRHLVSLAGECPHCRRPSKPLAVYSRPGHCSHCQHWLGESPAPSAEGGPDAAKGPDAALCRAEAIGELLAIVPRLEGCSLHSVLTANLRACVDIVTGGNVDAFARSCHVARSRLQSHLIGSSVPTIDVMLRICYRLDIPITLFLESDPRRAEPYWRQARKAVQHDRNIPARRTAEQVRLVLSRAAQEEPVPCLSEIARRLGYKGSERLYQVDRDLCKQIAAKYRKSGRSHLWKKPNAERICERVDLRRLLEQSLAQERPVSPHRIAASLGYANDGYLRLKFPDLCRAIAKKIAAQEAERLANMERYLTEALKEDPAPTLHDLGRRLGYSSSTCLQLHFPRLCQQILARRREVRHERIAEVKRTLQDLLLEVPAVSLRIASQRTGFSCLYLKELCPRECAALGSRYVRWRHESSERRKTDLFQQVRDAVRQLHNEGKCPTVKRVMSLLPTTALREWKTLTTAVKAARQTIETE